MSGMEKKRRDVETEGRYLCRTICNFATGSHRLLYLVLSVFVCTAASSDRYISQAREKERDAASRLLLYKKKRRAKNTGNAVGHARAVKSRDLYI